MELCKEIGCNNPRRSKSYRADGKQTSYSRCGACDRSVRSYGINTPDKLRMLKSQDNCCKICNSKIEFVQMKKGVNPKHRAVVDHCHSNGNVRGILCTPCNLLLGNAYDDSSILQSAIGYLEK